MEILSPSTSRKDQNEKLHLYEKHGVREYWIVDPSALSLWVYRLTKEGRYDEDELREPSLDYIPLRSGVLEGFSVDPRELFADLD